MRKTRVIVTLLLNDGRLVKTTRFKSPKYVGDPVNAVKIFNEKEVDELIFLDIGASRYRREPDFALLEDIAGEAFMPMSYGGGITSLDQARQIFSIGYEKVVVNSAAYIMPALISQIAEVFGSQGVVASIDVRRNFWGRLQLVSHGATKRHAVTIEEHLAALVDAGVGEVIVNAVDRDGTMAGYDLDVIRCISELVDVPVVALGGARNVEDFEQAIQVGRATAVAAGAMFVFVGPHRAVLVNYPTTESLSAHLD